MEQTSLGFTLFANPGEIRKGKKNIKLQLVARDKIKVSHKQKELD